MKSLNRRRAFSPVIATIILSAVVLAVGGAIWSISQGSITIIADDYIEGISDLVDKISERFIIEHVANNETHVRVWVYNHGEVAIVADVYVGIEGGGSGSTMGIEVAPSELVEVGVELMVSPMDELAVKVVSRRGNNAHYRYIAPQT